MALLRTPITQIATTTSGAATIFHRFQIDLCNAGNQLLADIIPRQRINSEHLLNIFDTLPPTGDKPLLSIWQNFDNCEFVDHLIKVFHNRHRQQLPELVRMAQHIEKHHANHPALPKGITQYIRNLQEDLEQHMVSEEQDLFPLINSTDYAQQRQRLAGLQFKHGEHEHAMHRIEQLTQHLKCHPSVQCGIWKALYFELGIFMEELREHVYLEDEIFFSRFSRS